MFNTIIEKTSAEIVEKKSKFICNVFHVESIDEAEKYICEIKKKYHDARHNCYAYSIENEITKSSDDGEPSGTAGVPILNILKGKNLSNIIVIVTRYFGGILLGTGGLVRAYSEATQKALDCAKFVKQELGLKAELLVEYKDIEELKYQFKNKKIKIIDSKYDEKVLLIVEGRKEDIQKIADGNISERIEISDFKILMSKYVEIDQ